MLDQLQRRFIHLLIELYKFLKKFKIPVKILPTHFFIGAHTIATHLIMDLQTSQTHLQNIFTPLQMNTHIFSIILHMQVHT